jgi:hypothetical protein
VTTADDISAYRIAQIQQLLTNRRSMQDMPVQPRVPAIFAFTSSHKNLMVLNLSNATDWCMMPLAI